MAIALPRTRAAIPPLQTSRRVLWLAVLPASLSLVDRLQTAVPLGTVTLAATVIAALALGMCALRHPHAWLWAGTLALTAAVYVQWSGGVGGPALELLALLALGAGGALRDEASHRSLLDALTISVPAPAVSAGDDDRHPSP